MERLQKMYHQEVFKRTLAEHFAPQPSTAMGQLLVAYLLTRMQRKLDALALEIMKLISSPRVKMLQQLGDGPVT
jgi:hypothetical protein